MYINRAMAAILMTSLFTEEADRRCVNWTKQLLNPQSLRTSDSHNEGLPTKMARKKVQRK